MLVLAWKTAARAVPLPAYLVLGLVVLASGPFAPLALFQNQPQILVAFLTVLAIERARAGAGVTAGAVLAVAVALKIAPILLLPALLVAGPTRRVALGFLTVGGALGVGSLALGGWAVHADFLHRLSTISATVVLSDAAYTLDALIAQFGFIDQMTFVELYPGLDPDLGWWVGAKPGLWRAASLVALLTLAAVPALALRRGAGVLIWPAWMIALALVGSVAWSFHYLAPLAFLPALLARLGMARGTLTAIALAFPGSYVALPLARDAVVLPFGDQALGALSLALIALVLGLLSRGPDRPLR